MKAIHDLAALVKRLFTQPDFSGWAWDGAHKMKRRRNGAWEYRDLTEEEEIETAALRSW
jgi:hypothetical protein